MHLLCVCVTVRLGWCPSSSTFQLPLLSLLLLLHLLLHLLSATVRTGAPPNTHTAATQAVLMQPTNPLTHPAIREVRWPRLLLLLLLHLAATAQPGAHSAGTAGWPLLLLLPPPVTRAAPVASLSDGTCTAAAWCAGGGGWTQRNSERPSIYVLGTGAAAAATAGSVCNCCVAWPVLPKPPPVRLPAVCDAHTPMHYSLPPKKGNSTLQSYTSPPFLLCRTCLACCCV